jgi:hypothetical protein
MRLKIGAKRYSDGLVVVSSRRVSLQTRCLLRGLLLLLWWCVSLLHVAGWVPHCMGMMGMVLSTVVSMEAFLYPTSGFLRVETAVSESCRGAQEPILDGGAPTLSETQRIH